MTGLLLTLSILQLLIPALLLFWQWRERSASKAQWLFKTILAISYLAAIAVAGLWSLIPFFVPYLYLLASAVFAARGFYQISKVPFWRSETAWRKIKLGITALLAFLSLGLMFYAVSGWVIPNEGDTANLVFPLKDGTFYIASGGSNSLLNPHLKTLEGERFQAWRGQSFAIDIMQINHWGLRADGILPEDPAEYTIFGTPVYAPCSGTIIQTENEREDLPPPQMDKTYLLGNHVLMDCGEFLVLLGHLKKGSVQVATGQEIEAGKMLGQIGNSGNTSEPHLHIHAQTRGTTQTAIDGEPLWMLFDGDFLVRNELVIR